MLSQPFILQLPVELCEKIVIACDSRQELNALRLTCSALATIARPALSFARIIISRLEADRELFEQIARDPSRAEYVREILWEDLDLHLQGKELALFEAQITSSNKFEVTRVKFLRDFAAGLPNGSLCQGLSSDWVAAGINNMRNLRTIIGRPIRRYRNIPHGSHEDRAEQYTCQISEYWKTRRPCGLGWRMVHPIVWHLPYWCKQPILNSIAGTSVDIVDARAFSYLTTMDIWVDMQPHRSGRALEQCLQAAKSMRDLKLRFQGGTYHQTGFFLRSLLDAAHWPSLHSFYMYGGMIVQDIANLGPQLRCLTLDECEEATYGFLNEIRENQSFPQLESIIFRCRNRHAALKLPVSQARILSFLRNESPNPQSTNTSVIPEEHLYVDTEWRGLKEPIDVEMERLIPEYQLFVDMERLATLA
ncbi:hypothetical protein F5Y09DRAFT_357600 [Xylaria sp. FL1042]|nr:hypothetical protein F5Y09DRAFT_357600 [Xylaria sp. FL1042]